MGDCGAVVWDIPGRGINFVSSQCRSKKKKKQTVPSGFLPKLGPFSTGVCAFFCDPYTGCGSRSVV